MRFQTGFTSCILKHLEYPLTRSSVSQHIQQRVWICEHIRRKSEKSLGTCNNTTPPHSSDLNKNIQNTISDTHNVDKVTKTETGSISDVSINDPALSTYIQGGESQSVSTRDVIPGKGMPPEPPVDCCMSGCANCVWIMYANELKQYYEKDGTERAKREIEKIENPSLKMFLKLELGLL